MEIKADEIANIKVIGTLNGEDVRLISTTGGFKVAVGKKNKYSDKTEALAAANHPAIVSYQIEKSFGSSFQPAIFKSESEQLHKVEDLSSTLPDMLKSAGIDLFVLSKLNNIEFVMCKNGIELAKYETEYNKDELVLKHFFSRDSISPNRCVSDVLAKAIDDKMKQLNIKKIKNESN